MPAYSHAGSYARLAQDVGKFCERVSTQREQLFRRMAFNCCISNTDDHDRNHGFLAADTPRLYELSPAYDLVPRRHGTRRREHALAIGDDGFVATRRNILSGCPAFGLTRRDATEILADIESRVRRHWKSALRAEGLNDAEIGEWAVCFQPLPDEL